jgi:hypothetical protein
MAVLGSEPLLDQRLRDKNTGKDVKFDFKERKRGTERRESHSSYRS